MTLLLSFDEGRVGILHFLEAFITDLESFLVLMAMIIYSQGDTTLDFTGLLHRHVELVIDFLALIKDTTLTDLFIPPVGTVLSLELVPALVLHLFNRANCRIVLALCFSLNYLKVFPSLDGGHIETVPEFLLAMICRRHLHLQILTDFCGVQELVRFDLLELSFSLLHVFFEPLLTQPVKF